jgi:hypothetical protein
VYKEVIHVPIRAPPHRQKLNQQPTAEQPIVVPLEQLWTQLPAPARQEALQRFTLMIVQQLAQPEQLREAGDE